MLMIIKFAIPVVISNIFQQLYTLCDTAIVSRGVGFEALAALGSTEWMNWILIGGVSSLTQGFAILVAQKYGENNIPALRKIIAMIIVCAIASTLVITVTLELMLGRALAWMNVSESLFPLAKTYCSILYAGTFATMFYNVFASILRALGNSKTPLYAIILSSVINIVLDIFFIFQLNMGVKGAAEATVIAQLIAGIYCFIAVMKYKEIIPGKSEWHIQWDLIKKLMQMSIPIVTECVVISVGGMIVQAIVNTYGTVFVAGFTTTNKTYNTLTIIASSIGYALATFTGQNYGAGYIERIKSAVKSVTILSVALSLIVMVLLMLFSRNIIGLLIYADSPEEIEAVNQASYYLKIFALFLWSLYMSTALRYALQGLGRTKTIMLSGIAGFFARVGIALTLPEFFGVNVLYFDEVTAWIIECLITTFGYILWLQSLNKNNVFKKVKFGLGGRSCGK